MKIKKIKNIILNLIFFCIHLLFIPSLMTFIGFGAAAVVRWHDIKGSYLIDSSTLAETTGTITSSGTYKGDKGNSTHYSIAYEYSVNGKIFQSDEVSFTHTGEANPEFANRYVKKYPVGKQITVYYDANNPSFSVLEPDQADSFTSLIWILVVSFVIVASGLCRKYYLKRKENTIVFSSD